MLGRPKHIRERVALFGERKSIIYLCKLKTKGELADKMFTLEGRIITLSNAYHVLSVISFNPQLPDHPMSDHSLLLFPSKHFITISTYLVCMFLYCLSSVFPMQLKLLGQEACLILSYTPLLAQDQAHSMQQIFIKRKKKLHRSPATYRPVLQTRILAYV